MTQPKQKMTPAGVRKTESSELRRLMEKTERLFSALEESLEIMASETFDSSSPRVDLCETNEEVCIFVELPGVLPDEIDLAVTQKDICVSGEKKHSSNTKGEVSHFCCERQYGKFSRRIKLHWAIDAKKTTANLASGVLKIRMPKLLKKRDKSIKIPVNSSE